MNRFHTVEIDCVISAAVTEENAPNLPEIIYSLGRDPENDKEYTYAFDKLVLLSNHPSTFIVSMVFLAFSFLALYHKRLDRTVVEPIIKRTWATAQGLDKARIQDALDDINHALKWNLTL